MEHGCDPSVGYLDGYTPLYVSCQKVGAVFVTIFLAHSFKGHYQVVRELVKSLKMDLNIVTRRGATSLYVAAQKGYMVRTRLPRFSNYVRR